MPAKKKLHPGRGAKASILTRFIKPKQQHIPASDHRSEVVLVDEIDDEQGKPCYQFRFVGSAPDGAVLYANKRYVKVIEEGEDDGFFEEAGEGEESKVKWADSQAKQVLYQDIINGEYQDKNGNLSMSIQEIYMSRPEFAAYDDKKFPSRLTAIRKAVKTSLNRKSADEEAFNIFKDKHPVSMFSHKGFIQWQGSKAQKLAKDDLENKRFDLTRKGGKGKPQGGYREMFLSKQEYYENFEFDVFSDKIRQEIKTGKYLHTLKVKGKQHKAS